VKKASHYKPWRIFSFTGGHKVAFDDGPTFEEPTQPYQQNFTVSWTGLVSRSFTLWGRKLGQYIMIAGLPVIIYTILEFAVFYLLFGDYAYLYIGTISPNPLNLIMNFYLMTVTDVVFLTATIALTIIMIIVYTLVAGATYKFGLDNYGAPDKGDVGGSYSFAFGRIVPLILVQLLVNVIGMVFILPGVVLMSIGMMTMDLYSLAMGSIGFLVGALIALYVGVRLSIAGILVIAEDHSVVDTVKKAFAMTSGQFWHIFAGQILLGIAVVLITMIITLFTIPIALVFGMTIFATLLATVIVLIITQLLFSPLSYIFSVVLYRDLASRTTVAQQEWW